jgi:hypothetical protein
MSDHPIAAEYCFGRTYHRFAAVPNSAQMCCMICHCYADAGTERVEEPISKLQAFRENMFGKHP